MKRRRVRRVAKTTTALRNLSRGRGRLLVSLLELNRGKHSLLPNNTIRTPLLSPLLTITRSRLAPLLPPAGWWLGVVGG